MNKLIKSLLTCLFLLYLPTGFANVDAGLAALEKGQQDKAIELLSEVPGDPRAQIGMAKAYLNSDLDEAEEWIEKALEAQPENPEVHYVLGIVRGNQAQNALFSALSYARKSKRAFETAVDLAPENLEYLQGLFSYHINAPSIAGGSLDKAKKLAEKIAAIDSIAGVVSEMRVAIAEEDTDAVNAILAAGLVAYPNNAELAYDAGMFFQEAEQWEKAFDTLNKAALAEDTDGDVSRYAAMYQIGRTAVFSKLRTLEGISALTNYIENAPEHPELAEKPWAEFRLAMLYDQNGRKEEAKSIFTRLAKSDNKQLRKQAKRQL